MQDRLSPADLDRLRVKAEKAIEENYSCPECGSELGGIEPVEPETVLTLVKMARSAPRWIPVGERLPEWGALVLAWDSEVGEIKEARLKKFPEGKFGFVHDDDLYGPHEFAASAWMPRPEPPK